MADNTELNVGSGGDIIATDDIGGTKHQRVKVQHGADGSATDVSSAAPLPVEIISDPSLVFQYLDTVGDGTGTKNANGDYSSGATQFYIAPGAGVVYDINRMIVTIQDGSGFRAERYGSFGAALTNGIRIEKQDNIGTTLLELDGGINVKSNGDWGRLCYDADLKSWGAGNEFLNVRWTFTKAGGPLRLTGDDNDRLTVILNDDLTGLVEHYFMAQGVIVTI